MTNANQKNTWKVINDVLGKNRSSASIPVINCDGRALTDASEICTSFNEYFCNVGKNLAESIDSDRDIYKFETLTPHQTSIFLRPTTVNEIIILINNLNSKKSAGSDNIPTTFVKQNHLIFAPLLMDVFNEIIETGQFPQCLKTARVVPLFKSGDAKDLNNYRPISNLSVLDKIIEKLIVSRIVSYASCFGLLYAHQYGFRQGSSTLTAACDLVDDIYDSLDNKRIVGALFIDLRKAFDTIDHTLLLKKLEPLGIRGVAGSLIKSYLENRQQYVTIGEHKSPLSFITTGVPQGSNLGPVLFLLFINDIAKLNLKGKLRLFADDTSLFYSGVACETIQNQIKEDIWLLNEYFKANLLSLNLQKTKYMFIHSPRRRIPPHAAIEFDGNEIGEVQDFKFLGLTLDSTMNWSAHIDFLKKKLSSFCGVMKKVSAFLPVSCLQTIVALS